MAAIKHLYAAAVGMGAVFAAAQADAALIFDQNITPDVIFGSGNTNGAWTVERNAAAGLEVGLRAKVRFDDSGQAQNIFNSLGNGTYVHEAGQFNNNGRARWNFEWSINSNYNGNGGPLAQYVYLLEMDTDPGAGTSFFSFDPINGGCFDHALGTNATGNGGGTSYDCATQAADYAIALATDNVAQNSWQLNFFPVGFDPDAPGLYEFRLSVQGPVGSAPLAQTAITVQLLPEPASIAVFGMGLAGLGFIRRRRSAR